MPAYVVCDIEVLDAEAYERYKQLAQASIAAHGGRYLVRGGTAELLEGAWAHQRVVVLEFPDLDTARGWWHSPEYAAAKAAREGIARGSFLLLDGLPG